MCTVYVKDSLTENQFRKLLRTYDNDEYVANLPPVGYIYDELRREERRNRIREKRSNQLLEGIRLEQEAERLYQKQPLVHRMDTYVSSREQSRANSSSADRRTHFLNNDGIESEHSEFNEKRLREYFCPSKEMISQKKDEKLISTLNRWKEDTTVKRRKLRKRKSRKSQSVLGMVSGYDDVYNFDRNDKRSKSELKIRSFDNESSVSLEEEIEKVKSIDIMDSNGLIRPYIKPAITTDKIIDTAEDKQKKKKKQIDISEKNNSISPQTPSIARFSETVVNRASNLTPLPSTSLYTKDTPEGIGNSSFDHSSTKLYPISRKSPLFPNIKNSNGCSPFLADQYTSIEALRNSLAHSVHFSDMSTLDNSMHSHEKDDIIFYQSLNMNQEQIATETKKGPEPMVGVIHSKKIEGNEYSYQGVSQSEVLKRLINEKRKKEAVHERLFPKNRFSAARNRTEKLKLFEVWEYWEDYKHRYNPEYHRKVVKKYGISGKSKLQADKLPKISFIPMENGEGFQSIISEESSSDSN